MVSRVVKTEDGSLTLYSERFKETYHSTTAGAFTEAVEKFYKPCKVEQIARERGVVRIFDSCFGLGYNTVAALKRLSEQVPQAKVEVIGFEFDRRVIEESLKLPWGEHEKWKFLLRELLKNRKCEPFGAESLNFYSPKLKVKIFLCEGRQLLKNLKLKEFADAVFHDPFSPKRNPELWTVEFFKGLRKIIKPEGILATYSASTAVRKGLLLSGFGVKEGVAVGRKSLSTLASPSFQTDEKLLKKLKRAEAVPFRDPDLNDPPELIKGRREGCLKLLKREIPLLPLYQP